MAKLTLDMYGTLTQTQPDGSAEGGDSVNWTGHFCYLTGAFLFGDIDRESNKEVAFSEFFEGSRFGAYVRHPDPLLTNNAFGAHYENPWNGCISRDQMTGIIAGLIAQSSCLAKLRFVAHHALSLFLFAYNNIANGEDPKTAKWRVPDLTLFDIWAIELRMFPVLAVLLYPLLCILDLHTFLACALERFSSDPDNISLAMKHIISYEVVPTPVSWLTRKVLDVEDMEHKLASYWGGWRSQSGMIELYTRRLK